MTQPEPISIRLGNIPSNCTLDPMRHFPLILTPPSFSILLRNDGITKDCLETTIHIFDQIRFILYGGLGIRYFSFILSLTMSIFNFASDPIKHENAFSFIYINPKLFQHEMQERNSNQISLFPDYTR